MNKEELENVYSRCRTCGDKWDSHDTISCFRLLFRMYVETADKSKVKVMNKGLLDFEKEIEQQAKRDFCENLENKLVELWKQGELGLLAYQRIGLILKELKKEHLQLKGNKMKCKYCKEKMPEDKFQDCDKSPSRFCIPEEF